jgi:hypothetical protein
MRRRREVLVELGNQRPLGPERTLGLDCRRGGAPEEREVRGGDCPPPDVRTSERGSQRDAGQPDGRDREVGADAPPQHQGNDECGDHGNERDRGSRVDKSGTRENHRQAGGTGARAVGREDQRSADELPQHEARDQPGDESAAHGSEPGGLLIEQENGWLDGDGHGVPFERSWLAR